VYGIGATDPLKNYESILSILLRAVAGKGVFYYASIGSILLVLSLSANTAFADFPRLCRIVALDGFLPLSFSSTGRRLVYTEGIVVLAVLTAALLALFGGVTDRLIPLYAVGAFMAFTLSQAGMVIHWKRRGGGHWNKILVNGLGAVATGVTTVVVLTAKFLEGAWVTVLLIPVMLLVMNLVKRHYINVAKEIASSEPVDLTDLHLPIVLTPIANWSKISQKALRFSFTLSHEVRAIHIRTEETENAFCAEWTRFAIGPASQAGLPPPELVILDSPYRHVLRSIVEYVLQVEQQNPDRHIAVVLPEMVERHWYHYFLHNQRAEILKALLLVHGSQRIVVIDVPWYLAS
jgi:hypothetical protein